MNAEKRPPPPADDGVDFATVRYETPTSGIARISLARPEVRNAQDKRMTYELNAAFDRAAQDPAVRVIVLAADGPDFCSGHDLRDRSSMAEFQPVTTWGGFTEPGAEGSMAVEEEIYLGMAWRWRNLPKPTIAQVQGRVIAGGLILVWVCDLIVASEDASFSDPVLAFGVNGVEYFAHPWEVGARTAKEMLFTGEAIGAHRARELGMVNRVVPRDQLETTTTELAQRIAARPAMGLRLAKLSANQAQDAQGFWSALQAAMSLQALGHAHNQIVHGSPVHPDGAAIIRGEAKQR